MKWNWRRSSIQFHQTDPRDIDASAEGRLIPAQFRQAVTEVPTQKNIP